MAHRSFEEPAVEAVEAVGFTLVDRTGTKHEFACLPDVPISVRLRMAQPVTETGLADLVEGMLVPGDDERWHALMADKAALIRPVRVAEVFDYITTELAIANGLTDREEAAAEGQQG